MRVAAVVGLGAVLAASVFALGGFGGKSEAEVRRPIVLVSGRDDHGILVRQRVGLARFAGGEPVASVPDGTLVRVEASRGEWLQVRALERTAARGWVNDFYLRGTAHLSRPVDGFPPDAQVELLAVERGLVRVRPVAGGRAAWVRRGAISELPASRSP